MLLFVGLGDPSAGGAYQAQLLPAFWRSIGGLLLNRAGANAVRRIIYFDGVGVTGEVLLVAGYVLVGTVVTLAASSHRRARGGPPGKTMTGSSPSPRTASPTQTA